MLLSLEYVSTFPQAHVPMRLLEHTFGMWRISLISTFFGIISAYVYPEIINDVSLRISSEDTSLWPPVFSDMTGDQSGVSLSFCIERMNLIEINNHREHTIFRDQSDVSPSRIIVAYHQRNTTQWSPLWQQIAFSSPYQGQRSKLRY